MSDTFNIDDAWDCDSIERKINDLEVAKIYPGDRIAEIIEKIDILKRRKTELDC